MNRLTLFSLVALMLVSIVACSTPEPTKEMMELQSMSADEVAFTYEAIKKMSAEELEKNIKDVSQRLEEKRQAMPRSLAGATMGSNEQPDDPAADATPTDPEGETISGLALPLEVMRQVLETKK